MLPLSDILPAASRFSKYNDLLRGFGPQLNTCRGTKYCTTMHVINSIIVKTAKLTRAGKVYRGVGVRFSRPNETNRHAEA